MHHFLPMHKQKKYNLELPRKLTYKQQSIDLYFLWKNLA